MPSPIGHALAGVATAWTADMLPGDHAWRVPPATASLYVRAGNGLTVACAALAMAPDLDLLMAGHRTLTHSIGATFFVALFAAAIAVNAGRPVLRVTLTCAAAYASHLLLDWLGADNSRPYGLRALWPFSNAYYISGLDIFRQTARRYITTPPVLEQNLLAVAQEIAILAPIAVALWLVRVKALARLAAEMSRRDHAAQ
jgi:membrane-bound metal-dependent hydrolase YbcI (DUF457 family)